MNEVRVDALTGLRSIIAVDRAHRPGAELEVAPAVPVDEAADPFLEGHEDRTPPELHAVRPDGGAPDTPGWRVRVVPNRYPAVTVDGDDPPRDANPDLFTAVRARGAHEVIVNSPRAVGSLGDLEPDEVAAAVDVWRDRMRAHADAAYVHVITNEGRDGGASLPHTHTQLFALEFVPAAIARERERAGAYNTRTMGGDLLGDLVQEEVRRRERLVAVDDEAVLFAPFASRLPFQLVLAPRRPRPRFEDDGPTGAAMLHEALTRLRRRFGTPPPLNVWVRTAPRGTTAFSWRMDIVPRVTPLAGLELGAGVHLNVLSPEQAAAELRAA